MDRLIKLLQEGDAETSLNISTQLRQIGEPAVPLLIQALNSPKSQARIAALLGSIGDKRAVMPLCSVLKQSLDSLTRYSAILALGELGDERALKPVIHALSDPDSAVRHTAAGALGDLGDTRALPYLLQAIQDPDWELRRQAAYSLGQLGDKRAISALVDVLYDEYSDVREWAAMALGMLASANMIEVLRALSSVEQNDVGVTTEGHTVSQAARDALTQIDRRKVDTTS